uniref:BTB domain-containing protein n=1 Tax=Megaselia scalaris TaxID=36166 RepID=T1GX08_MEGSC
MNSPNSCVGGGPIPPPPLPEKCSLPQQFCLKWNNYQTNLTNVFDNLLQNESFVDVTLACDGQSIKAHKMVLSACSPYFQALFYENPCQHPIVIMRDVKWPELKAVIEFMYKGEINIDREKIAPLLRVAEMLQIRGLAEVGGEVAHVAAQSSKKMRISEPNLTVSVGGGAGVTESSVSGNKRVHKRRNSHSPSMECVQAEILTTTPLLPLHSNFEDDEEEDEDDECDDEGGGGRSTLKSLHQAK